MKKLLISTVFVFFLVLAASLAAKPASATHGWSGVTNTGAPNAGALAAAAYTRTGSTAYAAFVANQYLQSLGYQTTVITNGVSAVVVCNNNSVVIITGKTPPPPPPPSPKEETKPKPPPPPAVVAPPPAVVAPPPAAVAPPPPPPPPVLLDSAASFVPGSWNKQSFQFGEQATATVKVSNLSNNDSSPATTLGVWPTGSPLPNCPASGQNPPAGQSYPVPSLGPGASTNIAIGFTVPNNPGSYTAQAYVVPSCNIADVNWSNNSTSYALNVSFGYVVNLNTWFESVNGDVGSQGTVSVSQTPPAGRYQSSFLLVGGSLDPKVQTEKWKINNYTSQLVPSGGVYNYLAERFLQTAKTSGQRRCTISAGNNDGFNYCSGDATFNAGNGPNGNSVWFIDGNLTISKDLTLSAGDTATFIVKGNVTVDTDVKRVDGIYVAGGTFNDIGSSGILGAQLVVNGGVYAQNVNLSRKLGGSACPGGVACDNALTPADRFVFDAKYLVGLNNILGTPSISWTETAP